MSARINRRKKMMKKLSWGLFASVIALIIFGVFIKISDIKNGAEDALLSVQSRIVRVGDKFKNFYTSIFDAEKILEENNRLKEENARLKALNNVNASILDENLRLLDMLDMKAKTTYKNSKICRVVLRKIDELNQRIYIDAGSEDGIMKDMVVTYGDTLVGKISSVKKHFSEVELISNSDIRISARVKDKNYLGIVQGSELDDGTLVFESTTPERSLEVGDEIYTSGISDIYDEGLFIGRVKSIKNSYDKIEVESGFSTENLKEVMVFKKSDELGVN